MLLTGSPEEAAAQLIAHLKSQGVWPEMEADAGKFHRLLEENEDLHRKNDILHRKNDILKQQIAVLLDKVVRLEREAMRAISAQADLEYRAGV